MARTGQHPWLHPGWKILPTRKVYQLLAICLNDNNNNRFCHGRILDPGSLALCLFLNVNFFLVRLGNCPEPIGILLSPNPTWVKRLHLTIFTGCVFCVRVCCEIAGKVPVILKRSPYGDLVQHLVHPSSYLCRILSTQVTQLCIKVHCLHL